MNVEEMRAIVKDAYPGRSWKARCSVMSSQQVIAIYHSIMERKKSVNKPNRGKSKSDPGYQFTIFDFMKGE